MENLRVGLIGLGNMGQNHLRVLSLLKMVELTFVYDTSVEAMDIAAKKYNVRPSNNLIEDLTSVDAVVIVTPTNTHYEYIKLVSDYVKNIFIEKPLTDNLETSKEIAQLALEKGLNIQVGFIERFNPAVVELKNILSHSSKVVNVDFTRTNRLSNRISDVDVIIDLMIHDIDLALFLNGEVESVFAHGISEGSMIAFASAILIHKNGSSSRIVASRITEKRIRQISATCDDMYIDCNLLKKEILINRQTIQQAYDYLSLASIEETVNVSNQEALLSEMIAFIQYAKQEETDLKIPDFNSGIKAMEIATEIQKQIRR